jgi:hypothetical protein
VASSAGLNRYNVPLLPIITPTTTAVANPVTGYGTLVSADPSSGTANDSGVYAVEAEGFTKLQFQLLGNLTGVSGAVTIYCTLDPLAYAVFLGNSGMGGVSGSVLKGEYKAGGYLITPGGAITVPATSWVKMEGPAAQTGTGGIANPLTAATPFFIAGYGVIAVRACVTTAFTGGLGSLVMAAFP